jgi:hypothetical protein
MFTFLKRRTKSPYQDEFVSGTLSAASDAAFMTRSLTEILDEEAELSFALRASSLSTLTETVT